MARYEDNIKFYISNRIKEESENIINKVLVNYKQVLDIDFITLDENYCQGWIDGWNSQAEINPVDEEYSYVYLWHDGNYYCGICGNSVDPIFNYCPTCGAIIDLRDVL